MSEYKLRDIYEPLLTIRVLRLFCLLMICLSAVSPGNTQEISAPEPQTGTIIGTVMDINGGTVPDATVILDGATTADYRTVATNADGFFVLSSLSPGIPYHIIVSDRGFANWTSPTVTLNPDQYLELTGIRLHLRTVITTVTAVGATPEEIAIEQVHLEEKQRVAGFIPNFYVTYDSHPAPLTAKLKFQLALRALGDPVTTGGFVLNAAIYQAVRYPSYVEGAKGYGQRLGATFAGGYTNVMVGDAILPSLLHQDPRYFYQGAGTRKSRVLHALSSVFITRGDNGHRELNYSSIGGDLASGAIANAYYPDRDRGTGLVIKSALIGVAGRAGNALLQEFVLRKFTSRAKQAK